MDDFGQHTPPPAFQDAPADTTTPHVLTQVARYRLGRRTIHPATARAIAAWFNESGIDDPFTAFSTGGLILETLPDAIIREIGAVRTSIGYAIVEPSPGDRATIVTEIDRINRAWLAERPGGHGEIGGSYDSLLSLYALRDYVYGCTVDTWSTGWNTVGYLPDPESVTNRALYRDAVEIFRGNVECANEYACRCDKYDCECVDGGELCCHHSIEAHAESWLADDAPTGAESPERQLPASFFANADCVPLATNFWLQPVRGFVRDLYPVV